MTEKKTAKRADWALFAKGGATLRSRNGLLRRIPARGWPRIRGFNASM